MRESPQTYSFDDFTLNLDRGCLLRGGQEIKLRPKSFDVLKYLIEHNGRLVSKSELMQAVWPDAFVTDNSLVQCLIEIRRALGDESQHFIKTVPRRGYIFEARINGSSVENPSAVAAGEVESSKLMIEIVNEKDQTGRESEERIVHLPPKRFIDLRRRLGQKLNNKGVVIGVVSLVLAVAFSLYLIINRLSHSVTGRPKTIAVLPFKPLVANNRDEALELGMADNLITRLSGLKQIIVRPTSTIRKYSSLDQDPLKAGRELMVEAVFDGYLHLAGEKVRVSARLLNTEDGSSIWEYQSEDYSTDIFTAQDVITEKIARALTLELTGEEQQHLAKRATNNSEAYKLFAKGQYHLYRRTRKDVEKSLNYFQEATRLDSNYALAYQGLAYAYLSHGTLSVVPSREVMPKAKEAVMRALEHDRFLAEAHATLGMVKFVYDWDWSGGEKEIKTAVELNPDSAEVLLAYALYLSSVGRADEAVAEINKALELDPALLFANRALGQILYLARQYDRAIDQLQKTIDLDPGFETTYKWISASYELKGDYEQSVQWDLKTIRGAKEINALTDAYAAKGWKGYWRKRLEIAQEEAKKTYYDSYHLVIMHARLGEKEQALRYLYKAYDERSSKMHYLKVDPKLDNLRSDPRFKILLQRVGFST